MTDENRYGEYECGAPECPAVFMERELRDRHYRRVHGDEKNGNVSDTHANRREHAPPLSREELLNPPDGDRD
jgi:hypothetical protein